MFTPAFIERNKMESLTITIISCFLLFIAYWILQRRHRRTPPGPFGFPIIGYIPFLTKKPFQDFEKLAKVYGPVFRLKLGSQIVIVLNDYQSVKEAFSQDAFMGRPLDLGLDLNEETRKTQAITGLPWKEQRRFSVHMLKDLGLGKSHMEDQIREEIKDILDHFEKAEGNPVNVPSVLAPSVSNNIGILVFGKRLKYDDPVRKMLDKSLTEAVQAAGSVSWQLFFPWLKAIFGFLGLGNLDRPERAFRPAKDYIAKEIKEHEQTLEDNNIRDFIDGYLLEINRREEPSFCKPVLQDLVTGFLGAGSETVRVTTEWLLLIMATYPDIQKKVQLEIDQAIGRDHLVEWREHPKMPYVQAVIMEAMRWRTAVPLNVLRYTLADTELNGYYIPKHCFIVANLWAVHHNPEYWGEDAELFRAERFLTEDGKGIKKSEYYIPFSIGKRQCPGEHLAKTEVFLYFVSILQRFTIKLPSGQAPSFEGNLGIGLQPIIQELCLVKRE